MNILEIDCESYATRVGYSAAAELYALLHDEPRSPETLSSFLPITVPEKTETELMDMGTYVCRKGCDSGERLFRWLKARGTYDMEWQDAPDQVRQTLDCFVSVCGQTHTKLRCLQITAEAAAKKPGKPKPVDIEDTIFEPEGSLAELLPHAVEASQHQVAAAKAEQESGQEGLEPMSLGETEHSANAGAGEAPETAIEGDAAPDLPPVPKTPARRKATSAEK